MALKSAVFSFLVSIVVGGLLASNSVQVGAQAPSADVSVENTAFTPASITVLVGTTVTWTQQDAIQHTVTVDDNQPEEWTDGVLLPMNTAGLLNEFEHIFDNLGTTTYHCEIHANMIGQVIVVESFDSPYVTVNANDANEFSPEVVEINATEGVLWINIGALQHTITFEDSSIGEVGILSEDEQIRFNFTDPGSYRYRCTYHSSDDFETGMVGKVVVGGIASFPTVLVIDEPRDGAIVNGTMDVGGRVVQGLGQPRVSDVEYKVDQEENWTSVTITDLPEFTWTFTVELSAYDEGNHTVVVRARSAEAEVARDTVSVEFKQTESAESGAGANPGVPAPSIAWFLLAALAFHFMVRRRDSR